MAKNKIERPEIPLQLLEKAESIKVFIQKLEELLDALHPNNIPVGHRKEYRVPTKFFTKPVVGHRFIVGLFSTSGVQEILSENTFRTYSSIYEWGIIPD